jgi:hypothetical protein
MKKTRPVRAMDKPKVKTQVGLEVNISAPRGTKITCKSWQTELRCDAHEQPFFTTETQRAQRGTRIRNKSKKRKPLSLAEAAGNAG